MILTSNFIRFYQNVSNSTQIQELNLHSHGKESYCSRPSAGPPFSTSDMTMDVSPLWKWGLSLPPEIAIPKPNPGACKTHNDMLTNRRGGNQNIQNSREELERDRMGQREWKDKKKRRKINEGMWWSERYRERAEKGREIERSYHRYKEE